MWNTSTTTLSVTLLCAVAFWYNTSGAATNGNKKIIIDWKTFSKSTDCKG